MTSLDTNAVVWLAGAPQLVSAQARRVIDRQAPLLLSPMVELEIQYLHEVGRLRQPAERVLQHLRGALDLRICERSFPDVVTVARELRWTRDPFDRLITAQAALGDDILLTADETIRAHYSGARG